jgi:predicted RNA binding protein YcfA (HicA-like mRNA interferase family)
MTKLRPLSARVVFKVLKKMGFERISQKGSHTKWKRPDGRITIVPFHSGEKIGKGLIKKIVSDIKITIDEFFKNI